MNNETIYTIDVLTLDEPLYIVGCGVRVKHGTPECFPSINALIDNFNKNCMASKIPNKSQPYRRFGICVDHVMYDDIIEFTYLTGVQVKTPLSESQRPATTILHEVPAGTYARIQVTAPNEDIAMSTSYMKLAQWIEESTEWEQAPGNECEVFPKEDTDAIMELWRPIRNKGNA